MLSCACALLTAKHAASDNVRRIAARHGWSEVQFNEVSRVIAFTRFNSDSRHTERVNVYYTTGTVATCVDHPRRDAPTQLEGTDDAIRPGQDLQQPASTHWCGE